MDMVFACFCFYYLYSFVLAQLPQHLSYIHLYLSVDYLSPIFGSKYYMVFTFPLRVC